MSAKPIKNTPAETPAPASEAVAAASAPAPAEAPAPAAEKTKGTPKSVSSRLVAPGKPDGKNPVEALILGYSTKSGWIVAATTFLAFYEKGKEREGTRGATIKVANLGEARKAVEKIEKAFLAAGWTKPETKPLGLERKADAFDLSNLPAPAKAKK